MLKLLERQTEKFDNKLSRAFKAVEKWSGNVFDFFFIMAEFTLLPALWLTILGFACYGVYKFFF